MLRIRLSSLLTEPFSSSRINTPLKYFMFNSLHFSIISKLLNGLITLNEFKNWGNSLNTFIPPAWLKRDHYLLVPNTIHHPKQHLSNYLHNPQDPISSTHLITFFQL